MLYLLVLFHLVSCLGKTAAAAGHGEMCNLTFTKEYQEYYRVFSSCKSFLYVIFIMNTANVGSFKT